jgi:hypothetical protein
MRRIGKDQLYDIVAIQQMLYDYCHELDAGAERVTDYFTEECTMIVGESAWYGHKGVRQHYADDKKAVAENCKDGLRTVRHAMVNQRITVGDDGTASVELIFLNFSAHGHGPFTQASTPTVVADTTVELKRGADELWRIHHFDGKPLFFGDDPFMNSILMDM